MIDYGTSNQKGYQFTRMLTATPSGNYIDSDSYTDRPTGAYSFSNNASNSIALTVNTDEMLKISKDGFYVRGVKVPVDDKEAETVYNAFKQFLVWAELNKR
jgi:hypothetical protein